VANFVGDWYSICFQCCDTVGWVTLTGGHPASKNTATTTFLSHHVSVMAVCCLQVRSTVICLRKDAALKLQGEAARETITDLFWQHRGSVLSPFGNIGIFQYFETVGWVTRRESGL